MQQFAGAHAQGPEPSFAVWVAVVDPFDKPAGKDLGRPGKVDSSALRGGGALRRIPFELHSWTIRVTRMVCKRIRKIHPSEASGSPTNQVPTAAPDVTLLRPPQALVPVPLDQPPARVRAWFDDAAEAIIPDGAGTLATARIAADAYARRATAANTRRAYRAGVHAWCVWCERHDLPCLPARAADVVAFLAAERGRGPSASPPSNCAAPPSAICISGAGMAAAG